jgi:hypothetical protein
MAHTTEKSSGFLRYFRYGVKFSERLFRNWFSQMKWLWDKNNQGGIKIKNWCRHNSWYPILVILGNNKINLAS